MTPPEWDEVTARALDELKRTGTFQPYEKEYHRRDGSRVPVLLGGAAFGREPAQAIAFVIDLRERKRAEILTAQVFVIRLHVARRAVIRSRSATLRASMTLI